MQEMCVSPAADLVVCTFSVHKDFELHRFISVFVNCQLNGFVEAFLDNGDKRISLCRPTSGAALNTHIHAAEEVSREYSGKNKKKEQ
jgi:hypothetical protein